MGGSVHAFCDVSVARSRVGHRFADHPQRVLLATVLASSLAFVDGSVVNVALPAIGRALGADAGALQWTINAYLLPLSATLLLGGAAGDRFGKRRMLLAGITLFALASLACALSTGISTLLVGRFVQGIGAALLMPNSLAILGSTFSVESKGRAVGTWSASSSAAAAIGPVLGGWLIDLGNWRAIFLINLPLAAAAMVLGWREIPPDEGDRAQRLDVLGAVLVTAGLGGVIWALTSASGQRAWTATNGLAAVVGLALLALFGLVENRRGDGALMPLALFGSRTLVALNAVTVLLYGALGALLVLVPYVLLRGSEYAATAAGAALLPLPITMSLLSPVAGSLTHRLGARLPIALGAALVGVGFLLTLTLQPDSAYWSSLFPATLVISVGLSAVVAPLTTAVLESIDARYTGAASGLNNAIARTGGLVATALVGGVLGSQGERLFASFHLAMMVSSLVCAGAALTGWLLVKR